MLLQAEAFSQGNFCTQKFFHRKVFFAQRSFYTQKLVHTEAFTHRSFYTGKRLDTEAITQRSRSTGQPSLDTLQNLTFAAFLDVRPSVPAKMRLENRKILHQFLTLSQFLTCSLDFVPKGGAKGRGPPNSHFLQHVWLPTSRICMSQQVWTRTISEGHVSMDTAWRPRHNSCVTISAHMTL